MKKILLAATAALVVVAAGIGVWLGLRPRVIKLWVVSDYAFRERSNWATVLDRRFRELNRLYEGTGIQWGVLNADHLDPVSNVQPLDLRRLELEKRVDSPADVVVSMTGQSENERVASVNPFSHALIIVDFPQQSEEQNLLNLVHEMARLFGAPVEPAGSGTVMALPPGSPRFSDRTARLLHRLRDYDFSHGIAALHGKWADKALDALAAASDQPSPKPEAHAHLVLAMALQNERRAAEAAPYAREAVKLDPQSVDARQALAHVLVDDFQADTALRELREAVRLFPNDAGLHATLGSLLGKQVATDEAIGELRKAEELAPKDPYYPVILGTVLVQQAGRMEEATAEFQKAAQLDPRQRAAHIWLARMVDMRAQASADLEEDRRLVKQSPKDPDAHYRMGIDHARLGNHEDARAAFQIAVTLNPRNGRALSDLAAMDYYCGDYIASNQHVAAARAAGVEPPAGLVDALEHRKKAQPQDPK